VFGEVIQDLEGLFTWRKLKVKVAEDMI